MSNLINTLLYTNAAVSSSFTTNALDVRRANGYSFQLNNTGLVGTAKVQESNDGVNWVDALNSAGSVIQASITAGAPALLIQPFAYSRSARLVFTYTSGTGTANVYAEAKG